MEVIFAEQARRTHSEAAQRAGAGQHGLGGEREAHHTVPRDDRTERVQRSARGAAECRAGRQVCVLPPRLTNPVLILCRGVILWPILENTADILFLTELPFQHFPTMHILLAIC